LHDRIKTWVLYHDGNLVYSKIATFVLVCITCIGTRNKKHLEFDARRMQVLYPLVGGMSELLILSVWLFGLSHGHEKLYSLRLNILLYMMASITCRYRPRPCSLGQHFSKFLKEGLAQGPLQPGE
jgi:hypothetical protein